MFQQIVNKWRRILPHGVLEQTGVLLWVISVLMIGLRITLIVPDQPIFLHVLQLSVITLTVVGALGALLSVMLLGLNVVAFFIRSSAIPAAHSVNHSIWRNKRSRLVPSHGSLVLFTVDTLLAAMIVSTAISWAELSRLDGWKVIYLTGLAALHITITILHERTSRR